MIDRSRTEGTAKKFKIMTDVIEVKVYDLTTKSDKSKLYLIYIGVNLLRIVACESTIAHIRNFQIGMLVYSPMLALKVEY